MFILIIITFFFFTVSQFCRLRKWEEGLINIFGINVMCVSKFFLLENCFCVCDCGAGTWYNIGNITETITSALVLSSNLGLTYIDVKDLESSCSKFIKQFTLVNVAYTILISY